MTLKAATYRDEDFSLHVGVLFSIVVHVIFLWYFLSIPQYKESQKAMEVIDVSIEPPHEEAKIARTERQLVSPSEETQKVPPKETTQESENDSTVIKEQIKRGTENAAPTVGKKEKPAPAPQKPAKAQEQSKAQKPQSKNELTPARENLPSLSDLKLDENTMLNEFAGAKGAGKMQGASRPFSRPQGSGAMFIGLNGSSDYIPNLPDGDITLLNAKANHFAVFVRRVAIQVFSRIRSLGWEGLSSNDIRQIGQDASVIAVMSPKGELLKVSLETTSQSRSFDNLIVQAAKLGTRDPNPPEGAKADDGNIHFIFKSRSWSEFGPGPGGIPSERRWLLLETGLE